jgi:hypothetical protein
MVTDPISCSMKTTASEQTTTSATCIARISQGFRSIFRQTQADGTSTRSIADIENSELFTLSPFKALMEHQANSVKEIIQGLPDDLDTETTKSNIVILLGRP